MALPDTDKLADAFQAFAQADSTVQVRILADVGRDTECADMLLGTLAGMEPDRYHALLPLLGWED